MKQDDAAPETKGRVLITKNQHVSTKPMLHRCLTNTESALRHAQAQVELVPLIQQWIHYIALQKVGRASQNGICAMEIHII